MNIIVNFYLFLNILAFAMGLAMGYENSYKFKLNIGMILFPSFLIGYFFVKLVFVEIKLFNKKRSK